MSIMSEVLGDFGPDLDGHAGLDHRGPSQGECGVDVCVAELRLFPPWEPRLALVCTA
jgi:hypothetical protein